MKIKLDKPLAFIDLETTGISITHDRIVEIAVLKLMPNGEREMKVRRINPGMPIPPEATRIHKITDQDVAHEPRFKQVARSLAEYIHDCDLAGFNSNHFDFPLLMEEFLRAGIDIDLKKVRFVDVQTIFHKMEQRTLVAAYKFYCGKNLEEAHSAGADISATLEVLEAQLDKYTELENSIDFLADFTTQNRNVDLAGRLVLNEQDQVVFNMGKHKGKPVTEVFKREPSYYNWLMDSEFPLQTKKVLSDIHNEMHQK